ncbi:MAG: hypothetical protein WAV98_00200 [Minisyncoccia bacterium]
MPFDKLLKTTMEEFKPQKIKDQSNLDDLQSRFENKIVGGAPGQGRIELPDDEKEKKKREILQFAIQNANSFDDLWEAIKDTLCLPGTFNTKIDEHGPLYPFYSSVSEAIEGKKIEVYLPGIEKRTKALFESYIESFLYHKNEADLVDIPNDYGLKDKIIELAKKTAQERREGFAKTIASNPDYN